MGVDTKIHIPLTNGEVHPTIKAIKRALKSLPIFGDIEEYIRHAPKAFDETNDKSRFDMYEAWDISFALDYPCDQYESGKEHRSLSVYYDHYDATNMIYLSLGCWGHNEDIARCLVDKFGGYADFSDCDDILIDYAMPQPKVKQLI
jgi:hypothetical protein